VLLEELHDMRDLLESISKRAKSLILVERANLCWAKDLGLECRTELFRWNRWCKFVVWSVKKDVNNTHDLDSEPQGTQIQVLTSDLERFILRIKNSTRKENITDV
jgi:hypothetical protein